MEIFILLAELPFFGIEISAPDLEIGASLCTLYKDVLQKFMKIVHKLSDISQLNTRKTKVIFISKKAISEFVHWDEKR